MGNFKPWIDAPTTGENGNILSSNDFYLSAERANGFQPGTVISSKQVNTALRQANLVCTALMELVDPKSSLSVESSVSTLKSVFNGYFSPMIVQVAYNNEKQTLIVRNRVGNTQEYVIGPFIQTIVERAEKDALGRVINETYSVKSWSEQSTGISPTELYDALFVSQWDGTSNSIWLRDEHVPNEDDNLLISIGDIATAEQAQAFNAAMLVYDGYDSEENQILVKALGTIPSIDIPVKVVRI